MLILLHVIIALASIITITTAALSVSQLLLRVSYVLTAATIASGSLLIVILHAPMLRTCETGLLYLAVASAGMAITRYRLKLAEARQRVE